MRRPNIGVIGERTTSAELYEEARVIGRQIAERGALLICGGLGGIMEAACRGCREGGGTSIGILPGDSTQDANPYVTVPVVTGMGEGRNIIVVRSSHVLIAVGGAYGTLSEIALALSLAIPVVGVQTWTFEPGSAAGPSIAAGTQHVIRVSNGAQAVEAAWRSLTQARPPV